MNRREVDDFFPSVLTHTSVDICVFRGAGILLGAWIASEGANSYADIRDGVNGAGDVVLRISALNHMTTDVLCNEPVLFPHGMFVDVENASAFVTVQWAPVPNKVDE